MTNLQSKRATLSDVAIQAGVSSQTVSRVINNSPQVSPKLRQKVLRVIAELDYQPNQAARSLKLQRSMLIYVFLFDEGYPLRIDRLIEKGRGLGYRLVPAYNVSGNSNTFRLTMEEAMTQMAEGILLFSASIENHHPDITRLNNRHIPIVYVDTYLGAPVASVVVDQRLGTRLATEHLIALGHRDIVEIAGPYHRLVDAQERHESWLATLHDHGLTPGRSLIGHSWGFSPQSGYAAMKALLESGDHFTAAVCANDGLAMGALHALWEAGKRAPDDCSIVGFDDSEISRYTMPPLTTVRQNFDAVAEQSIAYLVSLIEDPSTPVHQRVLYPELVVRQSTGPCPSNARR